jgi:3-hydroxybutyryl-CoA dehydrogenase
VDIQTVGVIGAGTIGAGVAQLCVQNRLEVLLIDETEEILSWAEERILRGLHRAEQPGAFSLMRKARDFRDIEHCDFLVETGPEDGEVKKNLIRRLDARLPLSKVLAIHTAVLPIGQLASAIENPDRVLGMHFFNPVPTTDLIELIVPEKISENSIRSALSLVTRLGKTAIRVRDIPGFIVSRVGRLFFLVSMRLLEQGRGTPATIDAALRQGGFRIGPFEFMDFVGLDEDLAISESLYNLSGHPDRLRPCAVQEKLVARGCRGRKNSRGFYVYGENPPGTVNPILKELVSGLGQHPVRDTDILQAVVQGVIHEAKACTAESVATKSDIDTAMRLSMNWPKGPFEWEQQSL